MNLRTALLGMAAIAASSAAGATAMYDFDTGSPALATGQSTPFDQTVNGITAQLQGTNFSLQTENTTFYKLHLFSGRFIYPNNGSRNTLTIVFDHKLSEVTLDFATLETQAAAEVPSNIQLSAYDQLTGQFAGSAVTHGDYVVGDTWPMGTLRFTSVSIPFDKIQIVVPWQATGTTSFFMDDLVVKTAAVSGTTATKLSVPARSVEIQGTTTLLAILREQTTNAVISGKKVQFSLDGAAIGPVQTTDVRGQATYQIFAPETMSLGAHTIGASYAGNATYAPTSGSNTLTVGPATTTILVAAKTSHPGKSVTLTATLLCRGTPIPSSMLQFYFGTGLIGPAATDATGVARISFITPAVGSYPINVTYGGSLYYKPGAGSGTLTSTRWPVKLVVRNRSGVAGQTLNLVANLTNSAGQGIPSANVRFEVGGIPAGLTITNAKGLASLPYVLPSIAGSYPIQAYFDADFDNAPGSGSATCSVW